MSVNLCLVIVTKAQLKRFTSKTNWLLQADTLVDAMYAFTEDVIEDMDSPDSYETDQMFDVIAWVLHTSDHVSGAYTNGLISASFPKAGEHDFLGYISPHDVATLANDLKNVETSTIDGKLGKLPLEVYGADIAKANPDFVLRKLSGLAEFCKLVASRDSGLIVQSC